MIVSSPDLDVAFVTRVSPLDDMLGSTFSLAGEIGMVSRGTCELGLSVFGAVSTAAMKRRRDEDQG